MVGRTLSAVTGIVLIASAMAFAPSVSAFLSLTSADSEYVHSVLRCGQIGDSPDSSCVRDVDAAGKGMKATGQAIESIIRPVLVR